MCFYAADKTDMMSEVPNVKLILYLNKDIYEVRAYQLLKHTSLLFLVFNVKRRICFLVGAYSVMIRLASDFCKY